MANCPDPFAPEDIFADPLMQVVLHLRFALNDAGPSNDPVIAHVEAAHRTALAMLENRSEHADA